MAFVIVYFFVFGVGTWYILRLMAKAPHPHESGVIEQEDGPIRTAGINPGPAQGTRPIAGEPADGPPVNADLTVIWAFVIAFAVVAYVVMDGFDLGIGMLFPFFRRGQGTRHGDERDRAGVGR